jgi:hypothetical protein
MRATAKLDAPVRKLVGRERELLPTEAVDEVGERTSLVRSSIVALVTVSAQAQRGGGAISR